MADLWPDADLGEMISDGEVLSFEAETAFTKAKCAYLSDDMKVSQAAAEQTCIGIFVNSGSNGEQASVCVRGVIKITAGGAIVRGAAVSGSDADGDPITLPEAAAVGDVNDLIAKKFATAFQTFADNDTGLIRVGK